MDAAMLRYWDGERWTPHVSPRPTRATAPPAPLPDSAWSAPDTSPQPPVVAPTPPTPPFAAAPPAPSAPPQVGRVNGLAVASLVLGIVWIWWIGSLLAVIFGRMAMKQIDESGGAQTGRGLAIAGLVLGLVGVGFLVLVLAVTMLGQNASMKFESVGTSIG